MQFFIMISLLLHVLSIIAIIVLFQKKSLENIDQSRTEEDNASINQSIQAFIKRIEKENESLYERLLRHVFRKEQEWNKKMKEIEVYMRYAKQPLAELDGEERIQRTEDLEPGREESYHLHKREGKKSEVIPPTHQAGSLTLHGDRQRNPEDRQKNKVGERESNVEENKKASTSKNTMEDEDHIQKVYDLHHQGFSKEQISKALHLGYGEVSFIVNMLEKHRSKGRVK